jgi:hypothetical protein
MQLRRFVVLSLLVVLLLNSASAGIPGDKAMYVGGTVSTIQKEATGPLSIADEKVLTFTSSKGNLSVSYDKIVSLAYGQHAGRRVGATVAWGVTTLGIMALPILFSKKRRHYLTIEYADAEGKSQAAVFEIGKDAIRYTLKSLEVRTGKKIEYEDDEARKAGNK